MVGLLSISPLATRSAAAQFFSPGDLASDHEALEGDGKCGDCHAKGNRVADAKCASCHQDVARTVRQRKGLHGRNYRDRSCSTCHVDHRGRNHELVRWDADAFDHSLTGWTLGGRHAGLDCRQCHDQKNSRGHPTYLGLSNACSSCHQDRHDGRFGQACGDCHDELRWTNVNLEHFDHGQARFALRGKHASAACEKCHGSPAKYQPLAFQTCGNCHEDPHRGSLGADCQSCHEEQSFKAVPQASHPGTKLSGGHAKVACQTCHDRGNLVVPSRGTRCSSCHAPVHQAKFGNDCSSCHGAIRWLGLPARLGRRVHGRTRYPLEGQHRKVKCSSCHLEKRPVAQRYRNLDFDACRDCHADPHDGQFADREQGECAACHDTDGFAPTAFGVALHATTAFELRGGHEAAPCGSCHAGKSPRLNWQTKKQACADCHDNPHGHQFDEEMRAGGCATCHEPSAWDAPNVSHETWPLTGRHATARCDQCHVASEEDRAAAGGISYRGVPRDCASCHEDIHFGQFRLTDPVRDCQECHETESFKLPNFDHAQQANYELTGKHAQLDCAKCHASEALEGERQTVRYRLPFSECRDCHADPHEEDR